LQLKFVNDINIKEKLPRLKYETLDGNGGIGKNKNKIVYLYVLNVSSFVGVSFFS